MTHLWTPVLFFGKTLTLKKNGAFGDDSRKLNYLWYQYQYQYLQFSEVFTVTLACRFNFQTFPFDSHECIVQLKNWIGASYRIQLNSISIYTHDKTGKENSGEKIAYRNNRLNYQFVLEPPEGLVPCAEENLPLHHLHNTTICGVLVILQLLCLKLKLQNWIKLEFRPSKRYQINITFINFYL